MSDLDAPRAVIYVRSSSVGHEREAAVIDALDALAADGVLDAVEVHTWPEKVSLEAVGRVGREFVEAFETFDAWAADHGVAVRPPFVVREQDCSITQEHDEVLVTPMLFLSVWDGRELAGVYPCSHADGVTTIEEFLASVHDEATGRDTRTPEESSRVDQLPTRGTDADSGRETHRERRRTRSRRTGTDGTDTRTGGRGRMRDSSTRDTES